MGQEIATKEEPEAAHLRGVLRQIQGILDRATRNDSHTITVDRAKQLIYEACAKALARPWTNGAAIDELTSKIAVLETKLVDQDVDRKLFQERAVEVLTLRQSLHSLAQERDALRATLASQIGQARSAGTGGAGAAILTEIADQLAFLVEYQVPPKPEKAARWQVELRALAQALSNPDGGPTEVTSRRE